MLSDAEANRATLTEGLVLPAMHDMTSLPVFADCFGAWSWHIFQEAARPEPKDEGCSLVRLSACGGIVTTSGRMMCSAGRVCFPPARARNELRTSVTRVPISEHTDVLMHKVRCRVGTSDGGY
jgi:hypothetical protein